MAAANLAAAARRAAQREDAAAAVALLRRALALVPDAPALLPGARRGALRERRMADAIRVLDDAIRDAPDVRWRTRAGVEREFVRLEGEAVAGTARALHVADAALRVLEHEGDADGQCRAWSLRAQAHWFAGSVGRADGLVGPRGGVREQGDERELFVILGWRATAAVLGPTPVDDAIGLCEAFRDRVGRARSRSR